MSDTAPSESPPVRVCEHCGKDIGHRHVSARYCDDKCKWKAHYARPENRARRLETSRRHKAANRERRLAQGREYRQRPEVKARQQAARRARYARRRCEGCGKSIPLHMNGNTRFCSKECWAADYYSRPETWARILAYARRPEVMERSRERLARKKAERAAQKQEEEAEAGRAG